MMKIDLHTHTSYGSACSYMTPDDLVQRAKAVGLDGVCITEHNQLWDQGVIARLSEKHSFLVIGGVEVMTDHGEMLVFGLHSSVRQVYAAEELRRMVDAVGGVMVAAHPFRREFANSHAYAVITPELIDEACSRPVFSFVDGLEIHNGMGSGKEHRFSTTISERLCLPGTGGSDAHAVLTIGTCYTAFEDEIADESDLVRAIKAGRCRAEVWQSGGSSRI